MIDAKLSKAKAKLLVEYPAFGHTISKMEFSPNDDIPHFLSDGKRFEYNDEFIEKANEEELTFALSHAALRSILNHQERKNKRAGYLWQLACDYTVSAMLKSSGFALPDFAPYQSRFEGLYAEEVYAILKEEIKNEEFSDDEELESGYNETNKQQQRRHHSPPPKNDKKQNERTRMEVELEERLAQKFIDDLLEKYYDEFPEPVKRHIAPRPASKIDWRHALRRAIERYAKTDYTLFPPSKKLLYEGVYLPSFGGEELRLAIAVDTSGSIDATLLERFLNEVATILLSFDSYTIEFFAADDAIRLHQTLYKGERFPPFLLGGCGTDFKVVFEAIEKKRLQPNLLVYFTDLEGFFPHKAPSYEVVWVSESEKAIPFGRKIKL